MRIIGGQFRGRRLRAPEGLSTRPMIARVREAVFNILGPRLHGARVGDCFSGTGAIGLEALSRGALYVDYYESGRLASKALLENVSALSVEANITLHRRPLPGAIVPGDPWDVLMIDPPWGKELGPPTASAALKAGRLHADSVVTLSERHGLGGDDAQWHGLGFEVMDRRRYGDSGLLLMRLVKSPDID